MEEKNIILDYEFAVLVDYINQYKNQGYNVYSDISEMKKLIEFITDWYEVKYPDNIINMSIECYKVGKGNGMYFFTKRPYITRKTENLSKYMDYYQLMLRMPVSMYKVIECWYKGNKGDKGDFSFATFISLKESLVENITRILVSNFDGFLDSTDAVLLNKNIKISCDTIDDLVDKNNFSSEREYFNFELSDPIKIVETHNIDLEIRKKIFNIIILKLFETAPDKNIGYIRAKLFINEFNKYIYNLNLDSKIIDDQMEDENFFEEDAIYVIEYTKIKDLTNYVIKDITADNSGNSPVDEYGLTFDTLKKLKIDGINNINDLLPEKNIITAMDIEIHGRYYYINTRDKLILERMKKEAMANLSSNATVNNLEIEEPKQKRKSIFRRKK